MKKISRAIYSMTFAFAITIASSAHAGLWSCVTVAKNSYNLAMHDGPHVISVLEKDPATAATIKDITSHVLALGHQGWFNKLWNYLFHLGPELYKLKNEIEKNKTTDAAVTSFVQELEGLSNNAKSCSW